MHSTSDKYDIKWAEARRYMVFVRRSGLTFIFHEADPDRRYFSYEPKINNYLFRVGPSGSK